MMLVRSQTRSKWTDRSSDAFASAACLIALSSFRWWIDLLPIGSNSSPIRPSYAFNQPLRHFLSPHPANTFNNSFHCVFTEAMMNVMNYLVRHTHFISSCRAVWCNFDGSLFIIRRELRWYKWNLWKLAAPRASSSMLLSPPPASFFLS